MYVQSTNEEIMHEPKPTFLPFRNQSICIFNLLADGIENLYDL